MKIFNLRYGKGIFAYFYLTNRRYKHYRSRNMTVGNERKSHLVTGGTGLLGSHIVEQLRHKGHRVRVLCRAGSDTSYVQSIGASIVEGDITNASSLRHACQDIDTVYHAAARVGDWGPWSEFVTISIDGTQHLLEAAAGAQVRRFIHISSISAYGHVNGRGLVLDESAPLGVNLAKWSYYSRAKVAAERSVWQMHKAVKLPVTVIRPSWLYGPRDRASMSRLCESIRKRKLKLIGNGENRLNLVHAANVAEAAILAAQSDNANGEAYNVCHDGHITQREYFNRIAAQLGEPEVTASIPYGLAKSLAFMLECVGHATKSKKAPLVTRYALWLMGRQCFFECEKIKKHLGWKSTIGYENGIAEAVDDYLTCGGPRSKDKAELQPSAQTTSKESV